MWGTRPLSLGLLAIGLGGGAQEPTANRADEIMGSSPREGGLDRWRSGDHAFALPAGRATDGLHKVAHFLLLARR